jgi:hypothetical protein
LYKTPPQFQKALDQLVFLPDNPERQRQELELWTALATVLNVHKGFVVPETGQAYARAQQLWQGLDAPPGFLRIPYGLSRNHVFQRNLPRHCLWIRNCCA